MKLLLLLITFLFPCYLESNSSISNVHASEVKAVKQSTCTLDVRVENHLTTAVEAVELWSAFDSEVFINIDPNPNEDASGFFEFDNTIGFNLCVTIGPNSGTGSIKVYREQTLVACQNFTSHATLSTIVCFPNDFISDLCPGSYFISIEPTNC